MVNKQKILIVDDDENIAELISLYLTKECFDTMIVHDGEEALKAFDLYHPSLILLDLMLPGIDGYQVCREIRSRSQTPIIMLSAKGEVFDKVLGLELGADDYIMKPFDSKEMVARVRAVLRRYQPARQEPPKEERGKCVEYPGHCHQSHQLLCPPGRKKCGYASQRAGAPLFSGLLPEPGLHKENSFWIRSGAMSTSATPGRWTCTSNASVRRSRTIRPGLLPPCGHRL